MAEEEATLKVTRDLKAAVCAILQGYGDGQGLVTDASAELHRFCGCLELLLQFDQKEQKSFLGPRKDYWDFLCTALRRQRGDMEQIHSVRSQDKLKTSVGRGRAFLRSCLARGQLAESLQLCLLSPELTREWYGPRSPLLCPELREDILDSLYALNGVAFDLDLQRPDLDEAWPMFSESCCSNTSHTQGRRQRKARVSPKKVSAAFRGPREVRLEEPHTSQPSCLQGAPREDKLGRLPGAPQHRPLPSVLEEKAEYSRSLSSSQSIWAPKEEGLQPDQEEGPSRTGMFLGNSAASTQRQEEEAKEAQKKEAGMEAGGRAILPAAEAHGTEDTHGEQAKWGPGQGPLTSSPRRETEAASGRRQELEVPRFLGKSWVLEDPEMEEVLTVGKPQEQAAVTSVSEREHQAGLLLHDVVKSLRDKLRKAEERAQGQEQLLRAQDGELQALRGQLRRCEEERARLQTELEQKQREAERRDAMYEEELGRQQDLIRAVKRKLLELIQEKDRQWQRLQQLPSVAPGGCVGCGKVFGRLSRRYPCRLCGGLVCHACSMDYKKREECCPRCAQRDAQVT
ncbi:RUN and FYVE domain-containing protein 4 [Ctenodactylus gundi]